MRKDKQIIVAEKIFLTLYCQRLLVVSLTKYFSFWVIRVFPFELFSLGKEKEFYDQNDGLVRGHGFQ